MALDENFMLQLPTDDSLPSKCWHTGSSRSFHKRYLLLIRRFPSCTPFHARHGIFLGLHYGLIYASCVYSSFLCTLRLFSAVLSDRGRETWQLAKGFFHRRVSFFLVQFIEAIAKRSARCQKSESTVSLLCSAKKATLKGPEHRLDSLHKDFFSLAFGG